MIAPTSSIELLDKLKLKVPGAVRPFGSLPNVLSGFWKSGVDFGDFSYYNNG